MNYIKLANIIKIQKGKKNQIADMPTKGSERLIQIDDLRNDTNIKYTNDKNGVSVNEDDLLIVWDGANAGTVGYGKKGYIGSTIAALKILDNNYNTEFLGKFLKTKFDYFQSNSSGATIPHVNKKSLEEIKIPVLTKIDQSRIASLLSRIEGLIAKRKESIQLLDEFVKSTFLEMFGTPSNNHKKFDVGKIDNLVSEVKYGTSAPAESEGKYMYLRMNNITTNGHWDFSDLKYINMADAGKEKYIIRSGDLVFNRTNSKELVGKTAVYSRDEEMIIAGYLIRVRVNEKANPWFIWGHLNSLYGKKTLFNLCRNIVGMANINAQELKSIKILCPPAQLQNKFAEIVEKIELMKTKYQGSLFELEKLYGSVSQRAFRGEI